MNRVRAQDLLALILMVMSGCGTETDRWKTGRPETAPVSGVVTFEGEPLEGAIVVFQPNAPTGMGASAVTDDEEQKDSFVAISAGKMMLPMNCRQNRKVRIRIDRLGAEGAAD